MWQDSYQQDREGFQQRSRYKMLDLLVIGASIQKLKFNAISYVYSTIISITHVD